jgi:hypothetical protein
MDKNQEEQIGISFAQIGLWFRGTVRRIYIVSVITWGLLAWVLLKLYHLV